MTPNEQLHVCNLVARGLTLAEAKACVANKGGAPSEAPVAAPLVDMPTPADEGATSAPPVSVKADKKPASAAKPAWAP